MQIKGEYEVTFLIQNMFHSYVLTTRDSNIVTDEGLNFILQVLGDKTTKKFGAVHVGKNDDEPTPLDTTSTFNSQVALNSYEIDVEGNTLTYSISTDGSYIDNTCEIGIWSDGTNPVLVTRDVHDRYDVPSSAIITIKYSLTLTNKAEEETQQTEEEENSND